MSMILMRTDLANDMRVIRLSDLTGAKVGAIIGGLHAVWSAAQTLSTDGFIRYMTAARIDRLAEVDGFAAAMVDVGWLKIVPDGSEFPDFDAYFGKSSKTRAIDRLRKNRDRKGVGKGGKPDKTRNESGQNSDKTRTESGHVRAPTHDKGKERNGSERIGTDRKESHLPPGGGPEPASGGGESESGEASASKPPQSKSASPEISNGNPATIGQDRFQGPADTSVPSPGAADPEPLSPYQLERMEAAGKLPHLRAFKAAYPPGRTKKKGPIRELWWRKGCEANPGPVMAGLARWNACDDWRGGYAENAENFLENDQWLDPTPAPKRKPGQEPAPVVDPAADAERDRCWGEFVALDELARAGILAAHPKAAAFVGKPLDAPGMKGAVAAAMRRVEV